MTRPKLCFLRVLKTRSGLVVCIYLEMMIYSHGSNALLSSWYLNVVVAVVSIANDMYVLLTFHSKVNFGGG